MSLHQGFAQSNGLVERTVETAKKLLKKTYEDNKNPYSGVYFTKYFNSWRWSFFHSVAHGASHRSIIPTKNTLLKPMAYNPCEVLRVLKKKKKRPAQKKYFDRRYKSLEPRKRRDIRVRQGGTWEPAELLGKSSKGEPRSYIVRANDHRYRRNRKEILKRQETPLHEELVQ